MNVCVCVLAIAKGLTLNIHAAAKTFENVYNLDRGGNVRSNVIIKQQLTVGCYVNFSLDFSLCVTQHFLCDWISCAQHARTHCSHGAYLSKRFSQKKDPNFKRVSNLFFFV